jgi:hypothetical protein
MNITEGIFDYLIWGNSSDGGGSGDSVYASALLGSTLASNVKDSSLTSVGILGSLTVSTPISGSITGSAGSVAIENITGTSLPTGIIDSNLTSLGTLTSLVVSGPSELKQTEGVPLTINRAASAVYVPTKQIFIKQVNVTSSGTKLTIPFYSQSVINCSAFIRISGVSAKYDVLGPAFSADISVGYPLSSPLTSLSTWNLGGNISSIAVDSLNLEISFTTDYSSITQSGIYLYLEYLGPMPNGSFGIDYASIVIN